MSGQPPRHYSEELQDLLDDRLPAPERAEVEAHLASCGRCQRELAALEGAKRQARRLSGEAKAPAELRSRLAAALDAEDRKTRRPFATRRAWIAAVAAAAVLVLIVQFREGLPTPERVAADYREFVAGAAPLSFESADAAAIEAYFSRSGPAFRTRVFDLAMMQYQLAGGRAHRLAGRPSALFAYRGPGGVALLCQMYEGRVEELPAAADVREHNGMTFHVYREGDLTLVFWQEGDVVCVLTSSAPTNDVVQLAFAKAVRVEREGA